MHSTAQHTFKCKEFVSATADHMLVCPFNTRIKVKETVARSQWHTFDKVTANSNEVKPSFFFAPPPIRGKLTLTQSHFKVAFRSGF